MDTYWNNDKMIRTENGLCINKCVRCGGCIAVCDYNVLHLDTIYTNRAKDGCLTVVRADDFCSLPCHHCHQCLEVCPVDSIEIERW